MDQPNILDLFKKEQPTRSQRITAIRRQLTALEKVLQEDKADYAMTSTYQRVLETLLENIEQPGVSPQVLELLQIFRENEDKQTKILEAVQQLQLYISKMGGIADLERQVLMQLQHVLNKT